VYHQHSEHCWGAGKKLLLASTGIPILLLLYFLEVQKDKLAYTSHDYGPYVARLNHFFDDDFPENLVPKFRVQLGPNHRAPDELPFS